MRKIVALSLLLALLCSCSTINTTPMPADSHNRWIDIYYVARSADTSPSISSEPCEIVSGDIYTMAHALLDMLKKPPVRNDYSPPIPHDTSVISMNLVDGNFTIVFSKEYARLSGVSRTLSDACIALSLSKNFGSVTRITIRIHGVPGETELNADALVLDELKLAVHEKTLNIYLPDYKKNVLNSETHEVKLAGDEPCEVRIMSLLISSGTAMPKGTRLLSVGTQDGICSLNLSSEFVKNHNSDKQHERLLLESIVRSLLESKSTTQVRITINGESLRAFTNFDLRLPLTMDTFDE
ncbi:MAG: GerMN domain-containing protein [Clostridia bacterium]